MVALWRRLALLSAACAMAVLSTVPSTVTAVPASPNTPVPAKYQVHIRVFFRAFCPACQWFVGDPVVELIRQEEFRNILNLDVYPAAGMSDKDGVFDCEGGDLECEGHQWLACIIDKDPTDVVKYVGNLACMEGDESGEVGEWDQKLGNCFTVEERAVLNECYVKKSAKLLRKMMGVKDFDHVEWMPYTMVEDLVLGSQSQGVSVEDMQTQLCKFYKGPKKFYPAPCESLIGARSDFAPESEADVATRSLMTPSPAELADPELEVDMPMKGDSEDTDPIQASKVRLEVYWRAFCPGCMGFVTKPLLKLLRDPEFRAIVDFRPVPAAGSWVDDKGGFVCTQGLVECQGHRWLSCIVDEFPKVEEMIEHLACLESKDNKGMVWSQVVKKCFPADDAARMKTCFSNKSRALLKANIEKLSKVQVGWVPFVRLNKVVLGDARHGIGFKQLRDEVCAAYKGGEFMLPNACKPKRLRQDGADGDAAAQAETDSPIIKPCPPKKDSDAKKAAAAAAAMALDKDLPGGGFRRPDNLSPGEEARELANAEAAAVAGDGRQGFSVGSLLFPLGCFAIIFVLARRLSGDHKKDA